MNRISCPGLQQHVGVLAYSPLAQGLLTGKFAPDTSFPKDDIRSETLFAPHNLTKISAILDTLRPLAKSHNATLGQVFLAWTLAQPGISTVLAGARNERQVHRNAHAAKLTLGAHDIAAIRAAVEGLAPQTYDPNRRSRQTSSFLSKSDE